MFNKLLKTVASYKFFWPISIVLIVSLITGLTLGLTMCAPGEFRIDFVTNGGTAVTPIIQKAKTPITAPSSTKTGYTLSGWHEDINLGDTAFVFDTMPNHDTTLYAKWTINQYTITFDTNNGSTINPLTADYGAPITMPNNPTKTEGAFLGWYQDIGLTTPFIFPATMPSINQTIYAKWDMNQYTITFVTNGDMPLDSISIDYGTTINLPVPTKTGHSFDSWYSDSGLTNEFVLTTMPNANLTLYGKWSINQYTLTFVTNGGTTITPITADYDTLYTQPSNPTKTGNTFAGWYLNSELTISTILPERIPEEDRIYYAKWTVNEYRVSFYSNDVIIPTQIATGNSHTLFLSNDGAVYGTGSNLNGQLGNGTLESTIDPTPVATSAFGTGEKIVQISVGRGTTSHLLSDAGRVYGMGSNNHNQIGDGTSSRRTIPTLLDTSNFQSGELVTMIGTGQSSGLLITNQHRIYGWGYNAYGQVGDGTTTNVNKPTLVTLPGLNVDERPIHVATSGYHSFALTSEARVFGWGNNSLGQLGDGTDVSKQTPTLISFSSYLEAGDSVKTIFAKSLTSYALTENGKIFAWGQNNYYQIGDGSQAARWVPVAVTIPEPEVGEKVMNLGGGDRHTLIVTNHNRVFGWGTCPYYELGLPTTLFKALPELVNILNYPAGVDILDIDGSYSASMLILSNGMMYGTGYNENGIFGDGLTTSKAAFYQYSLGGLTKITSDALYDYDETLNLPTPTKTGSTFIGWYLDAELVTAFTGTKMPDHDVVLYAKWSA